MKTRIRKLTALPAVAVLALTLAACGDDSSDSSGSNDTDSSSAENSSSSEDSTEGADDGADEGDGVTPGSKPGLKDGVLTGNGYAYEVPDQWEDQSKVAKGPSPQIDSAVARNGDKDGFADNVTVVVLDPSPVQDIKDIPTTLEKSLPGTKIEDLGQTTVAGEDASHIAATPAVPGGTGGTYELERYDVIKDGALYGIEFSFSPEISEADRRDISEDVIDSWTWTK